MVLSVRQVEVIRALYDKNLNLARGTEDERRILTRRIAEQLCFESGINWGTKSTSPSAPQSKDAIAFLRSPNVMDIWDWQNGSTREPRVFAGMSPDFPDTTGQNFITVMPIDHLSSGNGGNGDNGEDNTEVLAKLDKLSQEHAEIKALINAQNELINKVITAISEFDVSSIKFPAYESNRIPIFGVITLKPKQ